MSTIRKHYGKWQCLVRVKDHPQLIKSFILLDDAKRWANETELKIRREDAGITKIKFPTFHEVGLRIWLIFSFKCNNSQSQIFFYCILILQIVDQEVHIDISSINKNKEIRRRSTFI